MRVDSSSTDMQISGEEADSHSNSLINPNNGNIFMSGNGISGNEEFSRKMYKAKRYKPQ